MTNEWVLVRNANEPPFFSRRCTPGDGLHGYDPLSNTMIAHTAKEACEIDDRRRKAS